MLRGFFPQQLGAGAQVVAQFHADSLRGGFTLLFGKLGNTCFGATAGESFVVVAAKLRLE